jgi:hypothetical protein
MKKFKLTVKVMDNVLYEAVVCFDAVQYQQQLDLYSKHGLYRDFGIVEDLTGEVFNNNRDYVTEAPDAVIAAMICEHVTLFEEWDDLFLRHSLPKEVSVVAKVNNVRSFEWTCEPVAE